MENITDQEIEMLKTCKTEEDWNKACDTVKRARGGRYPNDWFHKVVLSGLMDQIMGEGASEIKVVGINVK